MRAFTRPFWLKDLSATAVQCQALEPVPLRLRNERHGDQGERVEPSSQAYDEAWLQRLMHDHPALLPIEQIEASYWPATPICMELPVASGFIDNLLLTPDGGVVIVEAKLWRNPQARREVVGQVLDYAKDLSALDYDGLQARVRTALKAPRADLFRLVHPDGDACEEAAFVDAVTRNLRLARLLALICGDGIQEGAEQLSEFLQRHLGLHFTLGLVEMSLWREPVGGAVLVQPRILARTLQIERAVVRVETGVALRPADLQPSPASVTRPTSLTEDAFYEAMATIEPGLPDRLRAFLKLLEPLEVYPEVKRNLSLKWRAPDGRSFHLGSIYADGQVGTDYAQWSVDSIGRVDIGTTYQEALAALLPGGSVRRTPKVTGWRVVVGVLNPQLDVLLDHQVGWIAAIEQFIDSLRQALGESVDA